MYETLDQALRRVWKDDWQFRASGKSLLSQAALAIKTVTEDAPAAIALAFPVGAVGPAQLSKATSKWYTEGLSPATITKRLNCLSKLGVSVEGTRPVKQRQTKWHLPEDQRWHVIQWCWASDNTDLRTLGDFVLWTTRTGLRVEESLRLTREHFSTDFAEFRVPGTKTESAEATLPLGLTMQEDAETIWVEKDEPADPRMFAIEYKALSRAWDACREHFGWEASTATLKALRRSAARYLHCDCGMPLHLVQQYLRHESMDTTLEYLRLTGGYNTEEMRRFLK